MFPPPGCPPTMPAWAQSQPPRSRHWPVPLLYQTANTLRAALFIPGPPAGGTRPMLTKWSGINGQLKAAMNKTRGKDGFPPNLDTSSHRDRPQSSPSTARTGKRNEIAEGPRTKREFWQKMEATGRLAWALHKGSECSESGSWMILPDCRTGQGGGAS